MINVSDQHVFTSALSDWSRQAKRLQSVALLDFMWGVFKSGEDRKKAIDSFLRERPLGPKVAALHFDISSFGPNPGSDIIQTDLANHTWHYTCALRHNDQ